MQHYAPETGWSPIEPEPADAAKATVTVTATPTPEATDTVTEEADEPAEVTEPPMFPKGYPKVVPVSTLPDQVKSWYRMDGTKRAVAVAPGVWAPMTPGATAEDVATAGVLDGFCGSIKAYERKFTPGEEHGGTCW